MGESVVKLVLFIGGSAIALLWEGFVLSVLWAWFIVPVFNAPALRIPYALGLAIIVSALTYKARKSEDIPDAAQCVIQSMVGSSCFLFFGWAVRFFI